MGNETMSEVAARNAAAEKAMADAIQTLEEALSDAAGLPEMERAEVYAERLGAVRGIIGEFIRRSMIGILAEDHGVSLRPEGGEGGEVMSTPNQKINEAL